MRSRRCAAGATSRRARCVSARRGSSSRSIASSARRLLSLLLLLRLRLHWRRDASDDVGVVCRVVDDLRARLERTRALAVFVLLLPEDFDVIEPRLANELDDLRHGPQAPLVGERWRDLAPVRELEVDLREVVAGDRVVRGLVPDVAEALLPPLFLLDLSRFVAAEEIADEDAVGPEVALGGLEVAAQF